MSGKPKHYLVFKILAAVALIVAILGFILVFTGFGNNAGSFMIGGIMVCFGIFAAVSCAIIGFGPEMTKMAAKSAKYLQEQNKDDLTDIATTGAKIQSEAVKTTARAVKEGLTDTKYCKHCGAQIDADSRFCKECGKEQ